MSQGYAFARRPRRVLPREDETPMDRALDEAGHWQHIRRLAKKLVLMKTDLGDEAACMDLVLEAGTTGDLALLEEIINEARTLKAQEMLG